MEIIDKKDNKKNSNLSIKQLWLKYMAYWPLFVLIFILSIAGWKYGKYRLKAGVTLLKNLLSNPTIISKRSIKS